MADFLVTRDRVAYRIVGLRGERHPDVVREAIDGMIREFRLHAGALRQGRIVYVPEDLPPAITDEWVARYCQRHGEVVE